MAKGAYSVICYPEDLQKVKLTIDDLVSSIQLTGGEVAYILHDKDNVKPHYHIICAWRVSPLPWDDVLYPSGNVKKSGFKSWMIKHCCSSPHTFSNGKSEKYHYPTALVRDIDAMLDYLTHEP